MNNIEINNFISWLAKIYIQNPNIEISSDTIYHQMMQYGLSAEEINNGGLVNEFIHLQNYFNNGNIRVFVHPNQSHFLQFWNDKREAKLEDMIKIYMSFPKDSIEECVKIIFDYIDKNNLSSHSKMANSVRSDSVVLRIDNQNDAANIINFINSNPYLRSKAKPTNPFVAKHGVCGFAYDELMSYNSVVSKLVSEYLSDLKENNALQTASSYGFLTFLNMSYHDKFINMTKLEELIQKEGYTNAQNRFRSIGHQISNRRKIEELLINHLNGNLDINKYFELYTRFKDNYICTSEENLYNRAYNAIQARKNGQQKQALDIKREIVDSYIEYELSQNQEQRLYLQLDAFVRQGKYSFITRTNGLRDAFINSNITGNDVLEITNNNISEYVKMYKNNKNSLLEYEKFKTSCINYFNTYGKENFITAFYKSYDENESMDYWCEKLLYDLGYEDTLPMGKNVINRIADQMEKNLILERQGVSK